MNTKESSFYAEPSLGGIRIPLYGSIIECQDRARELSRTMRTSIALYHLSTNRMVGLIEAVDA